MLGGKMYFVVFSFSLICLCICPSLSLFYDSDPNLISEEITIIKQNDLLDVDKISVDVNDPRVIKNAQFFVDELERMSNIENELQVVRVLEAFKQEISNNIVREITIEFGESNCEEGKCHVGTDKAVCTAKILEVPMILMRMLLGYECEE